MQVPEEHCWDEPSGALLGRARPEVLGRAGDEVLGRADDRQGRRDQGGVLHRGRQAVQEGHGQGMPLMAS
jgi:hypothetical protein